MVYRILKKIKKGALNFKLGFHEESFFELELNQYQNIQLETQGLKVLEIGESNLPDLLQIWNVDLERMKERLDSGDSKCFVSYLNEHPAAYHWIQTQGIHHIRPIGHRIAVPKSTFIFYHSRVSDKSRKMGINRKAMSEIIKVQIPLDFSKALIYTSSQNKAQLKSLSKMGFKKITAVRSIQIGSFYKSLSSVWA